MNINEKFIEASKLFREKKYDESRNMLIDYIKEADNLLKKQKKKCYSFRSLEQFYLFVRVFNVKEDISWLNIYSDEAYRLLAFMDVEEGKLENARKNIEKSFKYNPLNINTFFELVEVNKLEKNYDEMKEILDDLYPYILDSVNLARYYRNLGFYYTEKEEYELAFALYIISTHYSFSNIALDELLYIRNKMGDSSYMIEKVDAKNMLEKNNIPVGIYKKNILVLKELLQDKKIKDNRNYYKKLKADYEKLTNKIN